MLFLTGLFCFALLATSINANDTQQQATATLAPGTLDIELIYGNADTSFTIIIHSNSDLNGLILESIVRGEKKYQIISEIQAFNPPDSQSDNINRCLRYISEGARPALSNGCDAPLDNNTARNDVFWYDTLHNIGIPISVYWRNALVDTCSASEISCRIKSVYPPTPPPAPIVCASHTSEGALVPIQGSSHVIFAEPVSVECYRMFFEVSGNYNNVIASYKNYAGYDNWAPFSQQFSWIGVDANTTPPYVDIPYRGAMWFGASAYCQWLASELEYLEYTEGSLPSHEDLRQTRESLQFLSDKAWEWIALEEGHNSENYPLISWANLQTPLNLPVDGYPHEEYGDTADQAIFRCVLRK
jgi:hypothetical protein